MTNIQALAAQFCTRSTKTVNKATIDDEIKVHVATLDAFEQTGQLRSLVDSEAVNADTIAQAKQLVGNLNKLDFNQKQAILDQLKGMVNTAETQIMSKLLSASANSGETTITGLINAANAPEPEAPVQNSVSAVQLNGLGNLGSLIGALLGAVNQPVAPAAPVQNVVNGVDVNKVKQLVSAQGVDFSALRKAFNMQ